MLIILSDIINLLVSELEVENNSDLGFGCANF